jgi:glycosyltransferase involved in cell wall biosynthesis
LNLTIIIPLFNESNTIVNVLDRICNINFPEFIEKWEVVIVNDCSIDNSKSIVESYIDNKANFSLINHQINQGKGASIRSGADKMKGNVLLIQDADLELYPEDIPSMLEAMVELNVLFVNGSRYLPGVNRPLFAYNRYLGNKFFSFLTSLLINVKITDMACGYKLITKKLFDQINPQEKRFAIEAELMLKALKIQRNIITEVPVRYLPRNKGEGKKLKNSDAIKVLWKIIKVGVFNLK